MSYHSAITLGPDMPAMDPLIKLSLAKHCWNSLHLDCHDKDCECLCHSGDATEDDDITGAAI